MRVRVGVSACLLGAPVRPEGGNKRDAWIVEVLEPFVEMVPVCPEVELGLGVPRERIHLERVGSSLRLLSNETRRDLTDAMERFARERVQALRGLGLSGYVLKSKSPSCAKDSELGPGLFARELFSRLPGLVVEDEARLQDPLIRARFLERLLIFPSTTAPASGS
jgi:uncharacterized protein YbbK (DUF523 family)